MNVHGLAPGQAIAAVAAEREINAAPALLELLHKLEA